MKIQDLKAGDKILVKLGTSSLCLGTIALIKGSLMLVSEEAVSIGACWSLVELINPELTVCVNGEQTCIFK